MAVLRSLTYPLTLENGSLKLSEDFDVLKERIFQVLETVPYERVMQPTYGTPSFVFNTYPSIWIVVERVRISLTTQIPECEFEVSGKLGEDGVCSLAISWQARQVPQPPIAYRLGS
ncbi:MAG: hypothetical protein HC781_21595 [Leptolyngbyaceae cyanobacterium CSU_1_4]|nr:hypothetical protein [Leptolyngbyaceae cyanobacterium CSU_1_4]